MSSYLFGDLIFLAAWIVLLIARQDSRKIQVWGSLMLTPFAVLDFWFRPDYWNPPLLIQSIEPLSIETTIYCFTAGGIASVFGGLFLKPPKNFSVRWRPAILFFFISFALFGAFQYLGYFPAMNNLNFPFLLIWLFLLARDFRANSISIIPGVLFAVFTIIAVNIGSAVNPGFVAEYWNLPELWPLVLGTPSEEILFGAALGMLWTLLPKYLLRTGV